MYYSEPCSYCSKVFFTFNEDKAVASRKLYAAIKQHLKDYDEDHKEYKFDDGETADSNEIYGEMTESKDRPSGGYEV
jgi:hypothetical protein